MSKRIKISKLIENKLDSKNIDKDLKNLIFEILNFEISQYESKYSSHYDKLVTTYLRKKKGDNINENLLD